MFAPFLKAESSMRPTPSQTEGPFYPVVKIPLRQNLVLKPDTLIGEAITLQGKVLDVFGRPISGVKIEIWQCDGQGIYDHPNQPSQNKFDPSFSGFGATVTEEDGRYFFSNTVSCPIQLKTSSHSRQTVAWRPRIVDHPTLFERTDGQRMVGW